MRKYIIAALLLGMFVGLAACERQKPEEPKRMSDKKYNNLTPEEERVIVDKGTEAPGTGEYNDFAKKGYYLCKRCDAPLYRSEDKFASGCGWPSFDDEISGAVKHQPDVDGRRTEITCVSCGGHLGHVFKDEGYTDKNIRHCVNSLSMRFVAESDIARAYFAGGCFWGVEYHFERKTGVISAVSGFMGGAEKNPSYDDVSAGSTGHLEVVEIVYEKKKVGYEALAKLFFEIHDPTQANGQGPDIGEQYLSAIFYKDEAEKVVALRLIDILKEKGYDVATKVLPASEFWPADAYHQNYYQKKRQQPYCHEYERKFD